MRVKLAASCKDALKSTLSYSLVGVAADDDEGLCLLVCCLLTI